MTNITYREAIYKSMKDALRNNDSTIIMGQGVSDPTRVFGTVDGLLEQFGASRVIEMPIIEETQTGFSVGASLAGLYPIQTFLRVDFMLVAFSQIVNSVAKMKYMYGGEFSAPMLLRGVVGRSWGQGPQHSQCPASAFAHFPGLQVIMPATSQDVINSYKYAINNFKGPVLSIEHRLLYDYSFNEANNENAFTSYTIREGDTVTILAASNMVQESLKAATWIKEKQNIEIEVINLLNISNIDYDLIFKSLKKTQRLVIADPGRKEFGITAEITRRILSENSVELKSTPSFLAFAPTPCPTSHALEDDFYPSMATIVNAVYNQVYGVSHKHDVPSLDYCKTLAKEFKGPF